MAYYNLCGLFNCNIILVEKQQWYYLTHSWRDKRVGYTFPKGINLKVYIAWQEFKFAYFVAVVQYFSHYAIGTLPSCFMVINIEFLEIVFSIELSC